MVISGTVGDMAARLSIGRRRFRPSRVTGEVMGQPIKGTVTTSGSVLVFEGMAGEEPLRYQLDGNGVCWNFERDLGLRIVSQAFYSEITGTVERIPDAAMIALLLPGRLASRDPAYG